MESQGKVPKVLLPSTKADLAWEMVWGRDQSITGGCYLPGDHRLGLPLHADAHDDILTFSYRLVHERDLKENPKASGVTEHSPGCCELGDLGQRSLPHQSLAVSG